MVSAVVLLSVEHDQIGEVAEAVAGMDGVTAVYSVAGRYDLVAVGSASWGFMLPKVT